MSYFLKISKKSNKQYLQIYDSKRVKGKKNCVSTCYETLGYLDELITNEIPDPINFYKDKCKKLNLEVKEKKLAEKQKKIADDPIKNLGYCLPNYVFKKGETKKYFDLLKLKEDFRFDAYEIFTDLVFARMINPCSKYKTYLDVIPTLNKKITYSLDNVYSALDFFGENYEKITEILQEMTKKFTKLETSSVLFDCSNFYFEIDKEDEFRRKGPSKENRKDPIIGFGLLLDKNGIPICSKLYPGNQSEKPIIRQIISEMKTKNNISGRTIQVADKGLNCALNIYEALKNGDGYIFSKSVLQLEEKEKKRVFLDNDYAENKENGVTVFKIKSCIDTFTYKIIENGKIVNSFSVKEKRIVYFNKKLYDKKMYELAKIEEKINELCLSRAKKEEFKNYSSYVNMKAFNADGELLNVDIKAVKNIDKIEKEKKCAGYNMIITSEFNIENQEIYETYHNLWKTEETFRIMKTDLNTRPVYVQKIERIHGHFLICYTAVLVLRILQFIIFNKKYKSSEILKFITEFKVLWSGDKYVNLIKKDSLLDGINELLNVDLTNYFLKETTVNSLCSLK